MNRIGTPYLTDGMAALNEGGEPMRYSVMRLIEFSINGHKPVITQSDVLITAGGVRFYDDDKKVPPQRKSQ